MNMNRTIVLMLLFFASVTILIFVFHSERAFAALSFDSSATSAPTFDFVKNFSLLQPLNDFIKGLKGVHQSIPGFQLPAYGIQNNEVNYGKNITQWFSNFIQNAPLLNQIYLIFIKIVSLVGNLFIWILQFFIDLIKQGLSFILL